MLFVSALIHHVVGRMKYKQSDHWVGVPAPPGMYRSYIDVKCKGCQELGYNYALFLYLISHTPFLLSLSW